MAENDMVERVARAIYEATPFKETEGGFDVQSATYKRMCFLLARAAIEAMREPTDAMADDGYRAIKHGADAVWRAMIDAALNPEAEKP